MTKVACFSVTGIEMWIPSGDHEPPHFHARKPGEWSARVYFLEAPGEMIRRKRPRHARIRGNDRKALVTGAAANRTALLAEWQRCQG
jgi:hypothetical protein